MTEREPRIVVVGGGIAGLSAALTVRQAIPTARIIVIEQADRLGGKIRTGELAGIPFERGAESFLARRPEALDLAEGVGLTAAVRHPAIAAAGLWVDGQARPLPAKTVMGVPTDAETVAAAGVLPSDAVASIRAEPDRPGNDPLLGDEDVSVGALVRSRLPGIVVDRLVDPLLGGVYAGNADGLSVRLTVPALAAAAGEHSSLIEAARAAAGGPSRPAATGPPAGTPPPVFGSIIGGLSRLVDATATAADAQIRLGLPVRELHRRTTGWTVVVGSTRAPESIDADAVVLAVPAAPAARLLAAPVPAAAAALRPVEYASMALVALALPKTALPASGLPMASGVLVPVGSGLAIKAATYFSRKWPTPGEDADPLVRVRASIGRFGQATELRRDDGELIELVRRDLATILGIPLPPPVDASVTRWGGGLPQYAPGHADRVRLARTAVEATGSTLVLAGAAYDGVGIPACVRSGTIAGTQLAAALRAGRESSHG